MGRAHAGGTAGCAVTGHVCAAGGCDVCLDVGSLGVLAELLPLLDERGLQFVRMQLKHPGRWADDDGVRLMKADVLDWTCHQLVDRFGHPADYYALEMFPTVVDDLAELDGLQA